MYLDRIWENAWLTNHGPLVRELETGLQAFLGTEFLQFTNNGTIAIQIAIRALDLEGEIITTPFSYVATTTSILWEKSIPVFADIEDTTYCIDPDCIEALITPRTSAILATHVYGYPCQVEKIQAIADKYNLKVIYDGAHAFGVKYKGKSVFNFGDISTISFHATKLFHTVEGGAVVSCNADIDKKVLLLKAFGHIGDEYFSMGINGKNSEFHAAMGLCNLPRVNQFILDRKIRWELYNNLLVHARLKLPIVPDHVEYNYSYYPLVFASENLLLKVKDFLAAHNINTRRYFYPSLNQLPYVTGEPCPVSEDISARVLCLPMYQELALEDIRTICRLILESI